LSIDTYFRPFNATIRFFGDSIQIDSLKGKLLALIAEFEPLMSLDFHYMHKRLLASILLMLMALAVAGSVTGNLPNALISTVAGAENLSSSTSHALHDFDPGNAASSHHCEGDSQAECQGNSTSELECTPSFDCSFVAVTSENFAPDAVYGESRINHRSPVYKSITLLPAYMPPIHVYI